MYIQSPQPNNQCSKCNSLNHYTEFDEEEDIFNLDYETKVRYRMCKTCGHKAEISRMTATKGNILYIETEPYNPNPIKF